MHSEQSKVANSFFFSLSCVCMCVCVCVGGGGGGGGSHVFILTEGAIIICNSQR